jgi:hypothetical protein
LAAQVDHGLLNLVPAKTRMLAGIRIEQGKVSPLGQYLLQRAAVHEPQFQKLMDETGFDPRRDLQEILIATSGEQTETERHRSPVVLARGYFDPEHVRQTAITKGAYVESYQGFDIIGGKRSGPDGIVFLDKTLAAIGPRGDLKSLIASRNSPATLDPQLQQQTETVSTGNEAWFASIIPGSEFRAPSRFATENGKINGAILQSVIQSSGAVHCAAKSVDVKFDAVSRTDQDAQSLSDVIRFLANLVQMQSQNQKEAALLAPALDGMQLTTIGKATHVALSVPETTIERMMNTAATHDSSNE